MPIQIQQISMLYSICQPFQMNLQHDQHPNRHCLWQPLLPSLWAVNSTMMPRFLKFTLVINLSSQVKKILVLCKFGADCFFSPDLESLFILICHRPLRPKQHSLLGQIFDHSTWSLSKEWYKNTRTNQQWFSMFQTVSFALFAEHWVQQI